MYHIGLPILYANKDNKCIYVQLYMSQDSSYLSLNGFLCTLDRYPSFASIPRSHKAKVFQTLYITSGCDYISFLC